MLRAILEGKAGRVTNGDGQDLSWRELFRLREDLLSAVFFSRIQYLSDDGERNVLALLVGDDVADWIGPILDVMFWPKLYGLAGRSFVEPDVVINCEKSTLLVEVKPPFGGAQSSDQWRNEIESLILQKYSSDPILSIEGGIHFIALGRNAKDWQKDAIRLEADYMDEDVHIHALEWDRIRHGITLLHDMEEGRDRIIYRDWLEAFSLFGLIESSRPFTELLKLNGKLSKEWQRFFAPVPLDLHASSEKCDEWVSILKLGTKSKLDIQLWK